LIGAAAAGPVCVVALLACAIPGTAASALSQAEGTRGLFDRSNRFLDQRFPPAELTPSVVLADSFENPENTAKEWETKGLTIEQRGDHASDGQHSLKAVFARSRLVPPLSAGHAGLGRPGDRRGDRPGPAGLEFATRPRGFENLSFMIVYPAEKAATAEPELAALWRDLRCRFLAAFAPLPHSIAEKMRLPGLHEEMNPEARKRRWAELAPTEQETQQGYLLFSRDGIEEVYPDTVPTRAGCGAEHTAFGPPGEIESFAVGLLALRDMKGVRLEWATSPGRTARRSPETAPTSASSTVSTA
jgi:hypothetical protein